MTAPHSDAPTIAQLGAGSELGAAAAWLTPPDATKHIDVRTESGALRPADTLEVAEIEAALGDSPGTFDPYRHHDEIEAYFQRYQDKLSGPGLLLGFQDTLPELMIRGPGVNPESADAFSFRPADHGSERRWSAAVENWVREYSGKVYRPGRIETRAERQIMHLINAAFVRATRKMRWACSSDIAVGRCAQRQDASVMPGLRLTWGRTELHFDSEASFSLTPRIEAWLQSRWKSVFQAEVADVCEEFKDALPGAHGGLKLDVRRLVGDAIRRKQVTGRLTLAWRPAVDLRSLNGALRAFYASLDRDAIVAAAKLNPSAFSWPTYLLFTDARLRESALALAKEQGALALASMPDAVLNIYHQCYANPLVALETVRAAVRGLADHCGDDVAALLRASSPRYLARWACGVAKAVSTQLDASRPPDVEPATAAYNSAMHFAKQLARALAESEAGVLPWRDLISDGGWFPRFSSAVPAKDYDERCQNVLTLSLIARKNGWTRSRFNFALGSLEQGVLDKTPSAKALFDLFRIAESRSQEDRAGLLLEARLTRLLGPCAMVTTRAQDHGRAATRPVNWALSYVQRASRAMAPIAYYVTFQEHGTRFAYTLAIDAHGMVQPDEGNALLAIVDIKDPKDRKREHNNLGRPVDPIRAPATYTRVAEMPKRMAGHYAELVESVQRTLIELMTPSKTNKDLSARALFQAQGTERASESVLEHVQGLAFRDAYALTRIAAASRNAPAIELIARLTRRPTATTPAGRSLIDAVIEFGDVDAMQSVIDGLEKNDHAGPAFHPVISRSVLAAFERNPDLVQPMLRSGIRVPPALFDLIDQAHPSLFSVEATANILAAKMRQKLLDIQPQSSGVAEAPRKKQRASVASI